MSDSDRAAALKAVHEVLKDTKVNVDINHAIMSMAIRYGAARALAAGPTGHIAWVFADRARHRRFAALQRLVYGRTT